MPWKTGGPGGKEIVRADTGAVVGHSKSHEMAEKAVRARYAHASPRDKMIKAYNERKAKDCGGMSGCGGY